MPVDASSRCSLSFDAPHRAQIVRFERECHYQNSPQVCYEVQLDHRPEPLPQPNVQVAR